MYEENPLVPGHRRRFPQRTGFLLRGFHVRSVPSGMGSVCRLAPSRLLGRNGKEPCLGTGLARVMYPLLPAPDQRLRNGRQHHSRCDQYISERSRAGGSCYRRRYRNNTPDRSGRSDWVFPRNHLRDPSLFRASCPKKRIGYLGTCRNRKMIERRPNHRPPS